MNRNSIAVTALAALLACSAHGQALKNRRPGLWEVQYTADQGDKRAEQAERAERLAKMSPEQRAQMDAYLQQHGMGLTTGPNGAPMMTMRFCMTPQDIAQESRGLLKGATRDGDYESKVLSQSSTETHIRSTCRGPDGPAEVDAWIYDISAGRYAVDMKVRGPHGDTRMQQKARWLGSDCKGAAF